MRSLEQTGLVEAKPFLIEQDYNQYTPDQHALWGELVRRRMARANHSAEMAAHDSECTAKPVIDSCSHFAFAASQLSSPLRWGGEVADAESGA